MISRPDLNSFVPDLPTLSYPDHEISALERLEQLFIEWQQCFAKNIQKIQDHGSYYNADAMVCDGFYPHYFSQKPKVLFVGKESIGMSGQNYIQSLHHTYKSVKSLGRGKDGQGKEKRPTPLNKSKFHSRILKLTYALTKGLPSWKDIPRATEIGDTFGLDGGVSCAFMNLSKFSTERAFWSANWPLITASNRVSEGASFAEREVSILQPDIIIAMKLREGLALLGKRKPAGDSATTYWLNSNGHNSLLIETFHFSAVKSDTRDYYQPICDSIREYLPGVI
jgi:hypothetical protein